MRDAKPGTIFLEDYQPPAYLIDSTELSFELHEDHAIVNSRLTVRRNTAAQEGAGLYLHGQDLELLALAIDGRSLSADEYSLGAESLEIASVPASFELTCTTRIRPQDNTSLEGLYKSRTMFCTQCEAEGFRKITYYPGSSRCDVGVHRDHRRRQRTLPGAVEQRQLATTGRVCARAAACDLA